MKRIKIVAHRRITHLQELLLFFFLFSATFFTSSYASNTLTFIVLGDTRPTYLGLPQSRMFKQILSEIDLIHPDLAINVGDVVFGYLGNAKEVKREYEEYVATINNLTVPYYTTLGNHEVAGEKGEEYFKEYIGELYRSFDVKDAHFVILDTDMGGKPTARVSKDEIQWLEKDLEQNKKKWTFVFMHRPMYGNEDGSSTAWADKKERDRVADIFEKHGVNIVFAGDWHYYRKVVHKGITYYITGGGGAEIDNTPETGGFFHYLYVKVKKDKIDIKTILPYSTWVDVLDQKEDAVKVRVTSILGRGLFPMRWKGIPIKIRKLKEGERYTLKPFGRITKVVDNQDGTNTVYIALLLKPPLVNQEMTLSILKSEK